MLPKGVGWHIDSFLINEDFFFCKYCVFDSVLLLVFRCYEVISSALWNDVPCLPVVVVHFWHSAKFEYILLAWLRLCCASICRGSFCCMYVYVLVEVDFVGVCCCPGHRWHWWSLLGLAGSCASCCFNGVNGLSCWGSQHGRHMYFLSHAILVRILFMKHTWTLWLRWWNLSAQLDPQELHQEMKKFLQILISVAMSISALSGLMALIFVSMALYLCRSMSRHVPTPTTEIVWRAVGL